MKKCDIKGCKNKAEFFGKTLAFCREHWNKITSDGVDIDSEIFIEKKKPNPHLTMNDVFGERKEALTIAEKDDVKASLKEIKEGRSKKFKNVNDFLKKLKEKEARTS